MAENGWSTYAADRGIDNVTTYEMFDLRDNVSGSTNPFDTFGLMTDDYHPKPMFRIYRALISTLGAH